MLASKDIVPHKRIKIKLITLINQCFYQNIKPPCYFSLSTAVYKLNKYYPNKFAYDMKGCVRNN